MKLTPELKEIALKVAEEVYGPHDPECFEIDEFRLQFAERFLSAAKPLRDRIAELEAEVERLTGCAERSQGLYERERDLYDKQNAKLTKQRDDLLAALKSAVETIEWMYGCTAPAYDEVEKAIHEGNASIASVKDI